jgi:ATP-dependent DNA helicase RecG
LRKRAAAVPKEGIVFTRRMHLANRLLESLAFTLTSAQRRVLEKIERDMMSPRAMNRLLQGDVGSGKTVVALVAMLTAAENGYQVAFMAPTEILAEQHYLVIREMVRDLGVRVTLLRGAMRAAQRKEAQTAIATGASGIIIGTHALIEEDVGFHRLGMVVVDEQHRFGVAQRAALRKKGLTPDCLVMTATPIPRTLSMTLYGDLDVSALDEMPRGRKRIITRWVREEGARDRVYEFLRSQVRKGRQVYVVCPLVDETEKGDIRAATEMYERLRALVFPDLRVGLLHGRLRSDEKDGAMQAFRRGDLHLLVATTVIEVGVDVPNATVMLIEHAERFGLAQLHQLRGRVGRGAEQSYCLLLSSGRLSAEARERLSTMEQTQDGFRIAEIDLKLRGPGEFLGTRQHGLPDFKMADLLADVTVLRLARREAFDLIERDPLLLEREHTPVRRNLQHSFAERLDLIKIG